MTEQIHTVNLREQVLAVLKEIQKADATRFYWSAKLETLEMAEDIIKDLSEEEKKQLLELFVRTLNNLEQAHD